jgi:hypothetical protein
MRIGVVADTHMPRCAKALPAMLVRGLVEQRVELILHLGDFTHPAVPELFAALAPLDAVAGNNDPEQILQRFGRRKIVRAEGLRIGMVHGDGRGKATFDRARDAFAFDPVDVVAFGHSHVPYCARHGQVWFVNPGSPTDKRRAPRYSWCLLEIRGSTVEPALQYYEDKSQVA